MKGDALKQAWAGLLGLSAITAALTALVDAGWLAPALSALVLIPALLKARLILADYLALRAVPDWLRGVMWVMSLFVLAALGLYLAPIAVEHLR